MQLGKFEILEELGRGGFGIVYKARDMALDRLVALKILHPNLVNDPTFLGRFRQEARIAAQLDHPNLVPVYEFGESKGRYYIVMGYMGGGSLKELLKREGRLEPERAREVLGQISAGLTHAHRRGIIHRDLKPGNILFDGEGRARVSDMGFARLLGGESSLSMTGTGGIVGTPAYMAPEIWRGKGAGAAADVYSAACILVEMLTGKVLFEGESTPEVMFKHFEPLRLPDGLPQEWIPAIEQALEKDPEERTGTVEELVSGLRAQGPDEVDGGRQAEEEREGGTETAPGSQRPKKPALYLLLGLLAVVASFLVGQQVARPIRTATTAEPELAQVMEAAVLTATMVAETTAVPELVQVMETDTLKPTIVRSPECEQIEDVPWEECEALVSLYKRTNGDSWKYKYNWKKSTRVGSWYGITVRDGHVTYINLSANYLNGSIPPELGQLTNLELLFLYDNYLSGSIPPELGQLTNLELLFLYDNYLSGSIPSELGQLTKLVFLHLHSNQLSGSIPPELGQLTNLEKLYLDANQLSGSIPPELGQLTNLEKLYLNSNHLSGNIPPELGQLTKLEFLHLYSNQLSGRIPPELVNLRKCASLRLEYNRLDTNVGEPLANFLGKFIYYWAQTQSP